MKNFTLFFFVFGLSIHAAPSEISVVQVKRNIQMSETDPIYRDYYLDAGEEAGMKKNMVIEVLRKTSVKDSSGAHTYGEINIPVGQLKIISVFNKIAVAREYKLLSREEAPVLEQTGIMMGDTIETKGAFTDSGKTPSK